MKISPFTPLFFNNNRKADGRDSDYIQTFATTDQILIELLCNSNVSVNAIVRSEPDSSPLFPITFNSWAISSNKYLKFAVLSLSPGLYSVSILGIGHSTIFRVTDNEVELSKTTLIQYSMRNNRQRDDAVFFIDHMQYFFDFRVPGGFKDSDFTFGVEGEQFTTDKSDIVQLSALDSTQQKFTLGTSQGCPVWFAVLLNRLLCCNYVYFDGVRYTRKDTSTPEISVQLEGVNSFVFSQNLQRVVNIDPEIENNHNVIMRRVDNDFYRATTNNINLLIK